MLGGMSSNPILVASEDATLVAAIESSLHENGYRVSTSWADDDDRPGLIVLDTALPPAVRAEVLRHNTPIVALSAPDALRQAARTEGVWVCLAKPIELDSLVMAVDRISNYTGALAAGR